MIDYWKQFNDLQIKLNNELLRQGYITKQEHKQLIVKDGVVYDDTKYIIECSIESDDIYIHHRGAYPLILSKKEILGEKIK